MQCSKQARKRGIKSLGILILSLAILCVYVINTLTNINLYKVKRNYVNAIYDTHIKDTIEDNELENTDDTNCFINSNTVESNELENTDDTNCFINSNTVDMQATISKNGVYSSAVLLNADTMEVLYSDNKDTPLPMASTSKIMTALVVLEKCDLDKYFIIPKEGTYIEGSSIYLQEGERWKVRDLLYGLMLRSGNDSAAALAICTAGSVENFVVLMNNKAKELGLLNTNFANPHGLHADNHYTTAYELAKITAEAYKIKEFKDIVSAKSHRTDIIYDKENNESVRVFYNKNKMLSSYDGADGVKTGYTKKSGRCLVSSATRGNLRLIAVVLNKPDMWNDSKYILENGFKSYDKIDILKNDDIAGYINIKNSDDNYIAVKVDQDVSAYIKNYDSSLLKYSFEIDEDKSCAPININTNMGYLKIMYNNHLLFKVNIYNINYIKERGELMSNLSNN